MVGQRYDETTDRTGFDETKNYLTDAVGKVVPQWVSRRAVDVRVRTDKTAYEPGEPVVITVELRNRFPVPVEVPIRTRRLWGWEVDGVLEATDEAAYVRDTPTPFRFRAGETKTKTVTWNGHFRETTADGLDRSVPAEKGDHTLTAFLPVADDRPRREDSTLVRIV